MVSAKHFYNCKVNYVQEALDGLLLSNPEIARLDGYPHIKVILRKDWKLDHNGRKQVAVISGGGAGHEPSHAGFVGEGMLTAAVAGELFASPSVEAVLAAILSVTGSAGCLLIIKNYTGDRINFGLAAEKAKHYGINVSIVIVDDDIALETKMKRGIAGTLFMHKCVGSAAQSGYSLAELTNFAHRISSCIYSIGVTLTVCSFPGGTVSDRIGPYEMEVGLGIHGEPGAERREVTSSKDITSMMASKLVEKIPKDSKVALFLNNLGAVPVAEMHILMRDILLNSLLSSRIELILGPSTSMTSLDMNGFSISCITLDDEIRRHLLSKNHVSCWPAATVPSKQELRSLPRFVTFGFSPSSDPVIEAMIIKVCNSLKACKDQLDELDAKIGDGDTGTTIFNAANSILLNLSKFPLKSASKSALYFGGLLSQVMGGSSGVLLSIFFTAAGNHLKSNDDVWENIEAWKYGLEAIMRYGGAKLGDRTMLDSLIPAIDAMATSMEAASEASKKGVTATMNMDVSHAGRSSYVPATSLFGVADPGAVAVSIVFNNLALKQYNSIS
jgi:dihydroxyacetone kinase